ncbi:MAG: UDP-N-acetylmuramoyl-L-alanyl-D-glutamate--2,6-diaminopimelate ligase [Coriobacteriia bacterium]|nr:UDP-N-acetylmuramoyl-L-alanyl-D-glutamate--2,6-diaminopimelate ligase [Coriobacteriia bacterium]
MSELADSFLLPITIGDVLDRLGAAGELLANWHVDEQAKGLVPAHLSYDSRDVVGGSLFFCKGSGFRAEYLKDAIDKGAVAYVTDDAGLAGSQQGPGLSGTPAILVRNAPYAMALIASWYYQDLLKQIKIIGITGTKGKSSTVYFIKSILDCWMQAQGKPQTALLSSIDNYDGVVFEESHLTTKESLDLYCHFANAVSSCIGYLSMEVSSQALKYHRAAAVPFEVSCFLNFGRDHISEIEHPDLDDYLNSKLKIFAQSNTTCINAQSAEYDRILAESQKAQRVVSFGWEKSDDVHALSHSNEGGNSFTASVFGIEAGFQLGLLGKFNVENALAAIAVATTLGVPMDIIQTGLMAARVPGRMELFETNDQKTLIVDYAHNEMSFQALFEAVKESYPGRYIAIVFGCPGYKAIDRRHDLGTISGRQANDVVLTEEDCGFEDVYEICEDIAQYVRAAGQEPRIIVDRQKAIESAIDEAPPGAVVLLTGKGRETRQKRGNEYIEVMSDVEIVEQYLKRQARLAQENA